MANSKLKQKQFKLKFFVKIHQNLLHIGKSLKLPYRPNMNVISALMEIRQNPVTADGKQQLQ